MNSGFIVTMSPQMDWVKIKVFFSIEESRNQQRIDDKNWVLRKQKKDTYKNKVVRL